MAISTNFAPPFKLISPYFIIASIFYILSLLFLFTFDISNIEILNTNVLAFVHLLLLAFVMMVILGAMAQLIPVVLEVEHFAVELYYIIYPLLLIGSILMFFGFLNSPLLLPFGGLIVLIAMLIFVFETLLTIIKVKKINLVISTVALANIFLFIGLIFGILMSLGYAGIINIDISQYLFAHIYLVLIGYVGVTIMGMSLILLPMFWLSHSYSSKPTKYALYFISTAIFLIISNIIINSELISSIAYLLSLISFLLYFYQIFIIYKTRVRMDNDFYLKSMKISYSSLLIAIVFALYYFFDNSNNILLTISWVLTMGFISFVINGHLYKIIPFLVWFERFSPLVGKQKVPMLADIVPNKSAQIQIIFNFFGFIISAIGIFTMNNSIFYSGISFMAFGASFLLKDVLYMINYKG